MFLWNIMVGAMGLFLRKILLICVFLISFSQIAKTQEIRFESDQINTRKEQKSFVDRSDDQEFLCKKIKKAEKSQNKLLEKKERRKQKISYETLLFAPLEDLIIKRIYIL